MKTLYYLCNFPVDVKLLTLPEIKAYELIDQDIKTSTLGLILQGPMDSLCSTRFLSTPNSR